MQYQMGRRHLFSLFYQVWDGRRSYKAVQFRLYTPAGQVIPISRTVCVPSLQAVGNEMCLKCHHLMSRAQQPEFLLTVSMIQSGAPVRCTVFVLPVLRSKSQLLFELSFLLR